MNEDLAAGYDALVWIDQDGDVVCCAYTEGGARFLRSVLPGYRRGDIMQILSHPDEFTAAIPKKIIIGKVNPDDGKVYTLAHHRLH